MAQLIFGHALKRHFKRSAVLRRAVWGGEALMLGVFWLVCWALPVDWASALGRRLGALLGPRLEKNRHVRRNLELAFAECTEGEIAPLARAVWANAGAVVAEYPHLGRICSGEGAHRRRVELLVHEAVEVFRSGGRPAIFVAAHQGNWELSAGVVAGQGVPLAGFFTPLQNPLLDWMLARWRRRLGCQMLPRDGGMRQMMRALQRGSSIGFVMDQRVDSGAPVPMFGIPKHSTLIPARLALRMGCQLVPVRIERLRGAYFRIRIEPPLVSRNPDRPEREQARELTAQINALFEDWIRAQPGAWLCTKRRWPKGAVPATATAATREDTDPVTNRAR